MTQNSKGDVDTRIGYLLDKLQEEYEVVKRQGFPSRKNASYSRYSRKHDATIPEKRWRSWANELGIDYVQLQSLLEVLKNDGLLEKFDFISDYV